MEYTLDFFFGDVLHQLLLDLEIVEKPKAFYNQLWPLKTLAKQRYLDYLRLQSIRYDIFDEKEYDEIFLEKKDYIYFMGDFFRKYISQAETVVSDYSSEEDSEDSDDGSIVLDFYPSSDSD